MSTRHVEVGRDGCCGHGGGSGAGPGFDHLIGVEAAVERILAGVRAVEELEEQPLRQALGRVLARDLHAGRDVPPWANSAVDGFALRAADAAGEGSTELRIAQRVAAGQVGESLAPGTAARIFTGAPIPPGADAVVMQEHCTLGRNGVVVAGPVAVGLNVRGAGEDIREGTRLLPAGRRLRAPDIGLAASVGVEALSVRRALRVSVLTTGDELVEPGEPAPLGCIYNSNRYTLDGLLAGLGCDVRHSGCVPDDPGGTRTALEDAARGVDLVVSTGGVALGDADHVREAARSLGELSLWGVAVKPGKPVAFGRLGDAAFFGLPGNPVAVFVGFCLFVRPWILARLGAEGVRPVALRVPAAFRVAHASPRREFLRARLEPAGSGELQAAAFPNQSSGVLSSATWATGLAVVPEGQTVAPGQPVEFLPYAGLLG